MPRRDLLSEEKRKRLMQEHEQLQKLMLQSRSSVRRSSLKEQPENGHENKNESTRPGKKIDAPTAIETIKETEAPRRKTLLEKDLFGNTQTTQRNNAQPPLTETDLFTPAENEVTETPIAEKSNAPYIAPVTQQAARHTGKEPLVDEAAVTKTTSFEQVAADEYEEPYTAVFEKKEKPLKALKYVLLLVAALLVGFGGYYLYQVNHNNNKPIAQRKPVPAVPQPAPQTQATLPSVPDTKAKTNNVANRINTTSEPSTAKGIETKKKESTSVVKPPVAVAHNESATTSAAPLGRYKVLSKAYFYNAPDESTRRKAFIIHWNNAVLTPTEEKAGFVYVVFTNYLGQTSKGWLLKKDLTRID